MFVTNKLITLKKQSLIKLNNFQFINFSHKKDCFETFFQKLLVALKYAKQFKYHILFARLIKNNDIDMESNTGAHAAMTGVKMPFTPSELEKKDNT